MPKKKNKNITISIPSPILPGTISTAISKCGTAKCACKANPPKLHGPYYRWTGLIDGRQTTRTISKETAEECERRISNFRILQKKVKHLMHQALEDAPWKINAQKG
jgi:hypothetical protein